MSTYWLKYRGTRFPVRRGETIVGRSAYCTIVLSNQLASRQHCVLTLSQEGLVISDLGSTNGTLVNGEPLQAPRALAFGDVIRIGTDVLEVVEGGAVPERGTHRTISSQIRPLTPPAAMRFDDNSTEINNNTLDLVEALVASAAQTSNPRALVAPIQRGIEAILERSARGSHVVLDRASAARLRAVIESAAAWLPEDERETWRGMRLSALDALPLS